VKPSFLYRHVQEGASAPDLRRAYKRESLKHHPDKNRNSPAAAEKFAAVRASFELLVDPLERRAFERYKQAADEVEADKGQGRTAEEVERERKEAVGQYYGQAGQRGDVDMLNKAAFETMCKLAVGKAAGEWAKFVESNAATGAVDYNELLTHVYQKHNPEKLADAGFVAKTLKRYEGTEHVLLKRLRLKYPDEEKLKPKYQQPWPLSTSNPAPSDATVWILQFYAPWCPHCQNLKPYFIHAGRKLQARWGDAVKVGVVDCDSNRDFCGGGGGGGGGGGQNIRAYPVIRAFTFGVGKDGQAVQQSADFDEHTQVAYNLIPSRIVTFVKGLFDGVAKRRRDNWNGVYMAEYRRVQEREEKEGKQRKEKEKEKEEQRREAAVQQHEQQRQTELRQEEERQRQLPFRTLLSTLYKKYNPKKLEELEDILRFWQGKEDKMEEKLRELYPDFFRGKESGRGDTEEQGSMQESNGAEPKTKLKKKEFEFEFSK
jgi:curved DNA-binding protein CbpA